MWLYDEENTPTRNEKEFELKSMTLEKAQGNAMKESPMQNHYISSSYQRST